MPEVVVTAPAPTNEQARNLGHAPEGFLADNVSTARTDGTARPEPRLPVFVGGWNLRDRHCTGSASAILSRRPIPPRSSPGIGRALCAGLTHRS